MKNLHIALFLLSIFGWSSKVVAQQISVQNGEIPQIGIGIRANPDGVGITAKYFFIPQLSFEGMVNYSGGNFFGNGPAKTLLGLLEYNLIFNDPSWRIFIGPGTHITSWKEYPEINNYTKTELGLDLIIGIEYVFYEIPIGISLDAKPGLNFVNGITSFPENSLGLAVRYYFGNWSRQALENRDAIDSGR